MMKKDFLFLTRTNNSFAKIATQFMKRNIDPNNFFFQELDKGDKIKEDFRFGKYELIVSFLCPAIIPGYVLRRSREAINFHPGPPSYPGIGCTNWAIYNKEKEYGVTCHHMQNVCSTILPGVDTSCSMAPSLPDSGPIIAVRLFPIHETDTVVSLTLRSYVALLNLFFDIMDRVLSGEALSSNKNLKWGRVAYTRKELNDNLSKVTPDMDSKEVDRRIKAMKYPGHKGAWVEIKGHKFYHTT